jgi:hypothetical protein
MATNPESTLTCRSLLAGDCLVLVVWVRHRLQAGLRRAQSSRSYIRTTAAFAALSVFSVLSVVQIWSG